MYERYIDGAAEHASRNVPRSDYRVSGLAAKQAGMVCCPGLLGEFDGASFADDIYFDSTWVLHCAFDFGSDIAG